MKKLFLMILLISGISFGAKAQMCKITKGVEATSITHGDEIGTIMVVLDNTNPYKVTVDMKVVVADEYGNETERSKTVVIPANKKDKKVTFRVKKIKNSNGESVIPRADPKQSYVGDMIVSMCD